MYVFSFDIFFVIYLTVGKVNGTVQEQFFWHNDDSST